jgi:hypothetical protein
MSDETIGVESTEKRGISRRAALRAGVATGVGVAAWSGVTITSLGGTPAYAAACTNAAIFTLANCRNTDQGKCSGSSHIDLLAYHPLDTPFPPGSGFSLSNQVTGEGICCNQYPSPQLNPVFNFDNTKYTCLVRFKIYSSNSNCTANGTAGLDYNFVYPAGGTPDATGHIEIHLECPPQQGQAGGKNMANDFWSIIVICNSLAAPDSCYA